MIVEWQLGASGPAIEALAEDYMRQPVAYDQRKLDPAEWRVPSFLAHPIVQTHGSMHVKGLGKQRTLGCRQL